MRGSCPGRLPDTRCVPCPARSWQTQSPTGCAFRDWALAVPRRDRSPTGSRQGAPRVERTAYSLAGSFAASPYFLFQKARALPSLKFLIREFPAAGCQEFIVILQGFGALVQAVMRQGAKEIIPGDLGVQC